LSKGGTVNINSLMTINNQEKDILMICGKLLSKLSEKNNCNDCFFNPDFLLSHEFMNKSLTVTIALLSRANDPYLIYPYLDFISNLIEFTTKPKMIQIDDESHLASIILHLFALYSATNERCFYSLIRTSYLLSNFSDTIQSYFINNGLQPYLANALRHESDNIKTFSINCVEKLAQINYAMQKSLIDSGISNILLNILPKYSLRVKTMKALWAIAGKDRTHRKLIAFKIDLPILIETLISNYFYLIQLEEEEEKEVIKLFITKKKGRENDLYAIGCEALTVLFELPVNESYCYHTNFFELTNIVQLVKILSQSDPVELVASLRCISSLCVVCGDNAFERAQDELKSVDCIEILMNILCKNKDGLVKAEASLALASICLDNKNNMKFLMQLDPLFYSFIVVLLNSIDERVRLTAIKAISRFSLNSVPQEDNILQQGALSYQFFKVSS
jgi:hypothetical protein